MAVHLTDCVNAIECSWQMSLNVCVWGGCLCVRGVCVRMCVRVGVCVCECVCVLMPLSMYAGVTDCLLICYCFY